MEREHEASEPSDFEKAAMAADLALKALPVFIGLIQAVADLTRERGLPMGHPMLRALPHLLAARRTVSRPPTEGEPDGC